MGVVAGDLFVPGQVLIGLNQGEFGAIARPIRRCPTTSLGRPFTMPCGSPSFAAGAAVRRNPGRRKSVAAGSWAFRPRCLRFEVAGFAGVNEFGDAAGSATNYARRFSRRPMSEINWPARRTCRVVLT